MEWLSFGFSFLLSLSLQLYYRYLIFDYLTIIKRARSDRTVIKCGLIIIIAHDVKINSWSVYSLRYHTHVSRWLNDSGTRVKSQQERACNIRPCRIYILLLWKKKKGKVSLAATIGLKVKQPGISDI